MKLIILLISLFSITAFACPQLEGEYVCTDSNKRRTRLKVTQKVYDNGVTAYKYNSYWIYADGFRHASNLPGGGTSVTKNYCKDGALHMEYYYYRIAEFREDVNNKIHRTDEGLVREYVREWQSYRDKDDYRRKENIYNCIRN